MPTDEVRFNDEKLQGEKHVYIVLNKPKGYVTSLEDPHADKTVMDLLRDACSERVYPVGRLDKNSLGLLLFTNDLWLMDPSTSIMINMFPAQFFSNFIMTFLGRAALAVGLPMLGCGVYVLIKHKA